MINRDRRAELVAREHALSVRWNRAGHYQRAGGTCATDVSGIDYTTSPAAQGRRSIRFGNAIVLRNHLAADRIYAATRSITVLNFSPAFSST